MRRPGELEKASAGSAGIRSQILDKVASSPVNYWGGFITDPITAVLFFIWETTILQRSVYVSAAVYLGAIFFVSLVEYLLHRYIFHGPRQNMAQTGHLMHHDEPRAVIGTPWLLTQACLPHLRAAGDSAVVFVTDGHEAPPLGDTLLPMFDDLRPGDVRG